MKNFSISVITLTLNSEQNIRDCIVSVTTQTHQVDQHLIKDGGSTDHTLKVITELTDNIEVYQDKDSGIYSALNQALSEVRCDLVLLLHSDDALYDARVISDIIECFNLTNCDVMYGDVEIIHPETRQCLRYWRSSPFRRSRLFFGWMPAHTSLVMKKSVFDEIGDFDESYMISGDYDYVLRVFSRDDLAFEYLPRAITIMQAGGLSNRNFASFKLKWREDIRAARQLSSFPYLTVFFKRLRKLPQLFAKG